MAKLVRPLTLLCTAIAVGTVFVACGGEGEPASSTESPVAFVAPGDAAAGTGEAMGTIGVAGTGIVSETDVCGLILLEEAVQFAGESLEPPSSMILNNEIGQEVCTFGTTEPGSYTIVQVSVVKEEAMAAGLIAEGYSARRIFEDTRGSFEAVVNVPGVGDAAFRHGNTIEVLSGPVTFAITLSVHNGQNYQDASPETLITMANLVLTRLGGA